MITEVTVRKKCEVCKVGEMVIDTFLNNGFTLNTYVHKCLACAHRQVYSKQYPHTYIQYENKEEKWE
jgi:hypothetical protein